MRLLTYHSIRLTEQFGGPFLDKMGKAGLRQFFLVLDRRTEGTEVLTEVRLSHTNLRLTHAAHSVEHYVVDGAGFYGVEELRRDKLRINLINTDGFDDEGDLIRQWMTFLYSRKAGGSQSRPEGRLKKSKKKNRAWGRGFSSKYV